MHVLIRTFEFWSHIILRSKLLCIVGEVDFSEKIKKYFTLANSMIGKYGPKNSVQTYRNIEKTTTNICNQICFYFFFRNSVSLVSLKTPMGHKSTKKKIKIKTIQNLKTSKTISVSSGFKVKLTPLPSPREHKFFLTSSTFYKSEQWRFFWWLGRKNLRCICFDLNRWIEGT